MASSPRDVCFVPLAAEQMQQVASLFNHVIGASKQCRWHLETERLGSLEVDDEVEIGRLQDRKISWPGALENLSSVIADLATSVRNARAIAY